MAKYIREKTVFSENKVTLKYPGTENVSTEEKMVTDTNPTALENAMDKDTLRALYKDEIMEIIEEEKERAYRIAYDQAQQSLTQQTETRVAEAVAAATEKLNAESELFKVKGKQLEVLIRAFEKQTTKELKGLEPQAVELVYEACLKVIGEVASNKSLIISMVRKALERKMGDKLFTIRVSTADFECINNIDFQKEFGHCLDGVKIVADPDCQLGGCIIEFDTGTLDARLESQLSRFRQHLLDTFQGKTFD